MAYSYEQLRHIKADHPMVIAFGGAGTQKARFCRWRYKKDGTVEAMVQKWIARRKVWLPEPVPVPLDRIREA
jgi:hypothetical protein